MIYVKITYYNTHVNIVFLPTKRAIIVESLPYTYVKSQADGGRTWLCLT